VQSAPSLDHHELEVLDCVSHVDPTAVDAGLLQRGVEELPRRAHKWMTEPVFLISRLLTHEHDFGLW
jgi:hypothetical protein